MQSRLRSLLKEEKKKEGRKEGKEAEREEKSRRPPLLASGLSQRGGEGIGSAPSGPHLG